jgi:uncharacterized protein (TIGR04255 family)
MTHRPVDLPDFGNPPLVEVVLSVQFSELRNYRTVHAGLLWERNFRQSYPKFFEQPPLNPTFETFGARSSGHAKLEITPMPGPPVPRLWFVNSDDTELVQFQSDRFVHNWRKILGRDDYPRYEAIKDNFFMELKYIDDFVKKESIGQIEVNQCEVTYVNHIAVDRKQYIWTSPETALRAFSSVTGRAADPAARLPRMESAECSARYVIEGPEGPIGRLIIAAQPAIGISGQPVLRLDLTARGAPIEPTFDAVSDFLDLGRETIVRGFTASTTPAMHKEWGRLK